MSRFFNNYGVSEGKVRKYEFIKEGSPIKVPPSHVGNVTLAVPSVYTTNAEFRIELECNCGKTKYIAECIINSDDFNKHNVVDIVKIKDT